MAWIANACFALFWPAAGTGAAPFAKEGWLWLPLLAGGMVAIFFSGRAEPPPASRAWGALCLPALVAAVLLPFPYSVPPLLLGAAGLLRLARFEERVARTGMVTAGLLSLQAIVVAPMGIVASQVHAIDALAWPLWALLRIAGADPDLQGAQIFVHTNGITRVYRPLVEMLGIWPLIPFGLCGLFLARGNLGRYLETLGIYTSLRALVGTLLYLDSGSIEWFWKPGLDSVGIGLLAVSLWRRIPAATPRLGIEGDAAPVRPALAAASFAVLAASAGCFALFYEDPGTRKPGRILIDEYHSNWEWTEEPLDRNRYGRRSTYNYWCLADYLSHYYPRIDRNHQPLTSDGLESYDVLILKTPHIDFSAAETEAVEKFVRTGGGLWVFADHSDVLGCATVLNPLMARFGITFGTESAFALDPPFMHQTYYGPPMLRHPTVRQVDIMPFASSCPVLCAPGAWPILLRERHWTEQVDYTPYNFAARESPSAAEPFGTVAAGAVARYGEGRVAAFADSTMMSNFIFFASGVPELSLGTVEWLNHRNASPAAPRAAALAAAAALLALLAVWAVSPRSTVGLWPGLWVGVAAGLSAADFASRTDPPKPIKPMVTVAFDYEWDHVFLPRKHSVHYVPFESYQTFFIWFGRINMKPKIRNRFEDCVHDPMTILIEPQSVPDPDTVRRYVRDGGILLVLDDPANHSNAAARILAPFGLTLGAHVDDEPLALAGTQGTIEGIAPKHFKEIRGGKPWIVGAKSGRACLAGVEFGLGKVAAFGASRIFSAQAMGDVAATPTAPQKNLFQLQYWLIETVLGLRAP